MSSLEGDANSELQHPGPFFQQQFEGICQYFDLASGADRSVSNKPSSLVKLLACRPTSSRKHEDTAFGTLSSVAIFSGTERQCDSIALQGNLSTAVPGRLDQIESVTLDRMSLLQNELNILAESISSASRELSVDQSDMLKKEWLSLTRHIILSHEDLFQPPSSDIIKELLDLLHRGEVLDINAYSVLCEALPKTEHLKDVLSHLTSHEKSVQDPIEAPGSIVKAGESWILLALACLRLYVPDKPLDPSMELVV